MHLKFNSIRIVRFRTFLDETIVHFDDAGPGLYFLKGRNEVQKALGSNGAGKSTIIEALLWCLFGRTSKGLKNPDIVPWSGKGTTEVEVTIQIDKKKHVIKRTANPNLITDNGTEVGQADVSKLIPIPLDIIPYTVILGQKQPLFFDLTPGDKLKALSEPLEMSRWDDRSEHASNMVKNLEADIKASLVEVEMWKDAVEHLKADMLTLKARSEDWESKRQEALGDHNKELEKFLKQIADVQDKRDAADLQLEEAEVRLRASNIETLRSEARAASLAFAKSEIALKATNANVDDIIAQIESAKEQVCPTCKQLLKGKHHQNKLVDALEKQISDMNLSDRRKEYKEIKERSEKADMALKIAETEVDISRRGSDRARDVLDQCNNIIATANGQIQAIKRLKEEYEGQDNPFREQIQTVRSRITETTTRIEDRTAKLDTKKQYCERVRYWIKGFKDIKLYTLEEILQELEITTSGMLDQFGLGGWNIHYDVERETKKGTIARGLNVEVLSPDNKEPVRWECWSGGTAQRISLIGSLALRSVLLNHLGVTTNLAVFDEPTIGLSVEGLDDLVELLASIAKEAESCVWLVDHHVIESSKFTKIVSVVRDSKGSHISYE